MKFFSKWFLILTCLSVAKVEGQELIQIYPSDNTLFTQGFTLDDNNRLLLGTGQYGASKIGYLDLKSGQFTDKDFLDSDFFGEGITDTPYGIWQLTWKEGKAFLRDLDSFEVIKEADYDHEGWGITYDPQEDILWVSDGSSSLYKRDAETFNLIDKITISDNDGQVELLNELEYANESIYANVWYSSIILRIDPKKGQVIQSFDFSQMIEDTHLTQEEREKMDVLNGIAHIEEDRFYITGKYYPVIYEVIMKSEEGANE